MIFDGQTVAELVLKFPGLSFPLAFVAPIIGGEMAVLVLASLAAQWGFSLLGIIAGSFLGMLLLDAFWFFVPRSPWAKRFSKRFTVSEKYQRLEAQLESFSRHSDILILLLSKVLIGTRILILAYLSVRRITFRRFMLYDSIATFLWALGLGYVGWFAGLGYYTLSRAYHDITIGIFYFILVLGTFYGLLWYVRRWIIRT